MGAGGSSAAENRPSSDHMMARPASSDTTTNSLKGRETLFRFAAGATTFYLDACRAAGEARLRSEKAPEFVRPELIHRVFNKLDHDKSGFLDEKKLAHVAQTCKCDVTKEHARVALATLNAVNNQVTCENFSNWYVGEKDGESSWLKALRTMMLRFFVKDLYDKMDTDRSGTVDIQKLAYVAKSFGCEVTQECGREALRGLNVELSGNSNPNVPFDKFFAWFTKGGPARDGLWLSAIRTMMKKALPHRIEPPQVPSSLDTSLNEVFQQAVDLEPQSSTAIERVAQVFKARVDHFLHRIVTELIDQEGTTPSGPGKFYVQDGLFAFRWTFKNSPWVRTMGQLERQGARNVLRCNIRHLHVPLTTHGSYLGHHFTVMALVPLCPTSYTPAAPPPLENVANGISSLLGLKSTNPAGWQVSQGTDGRLYSLGNYAWCVYTPPLLSKHSNPNAVMAKFRPELLLRNLQPIDIGHETMCSGDGCDDASRQLFRELVDLVVPIAAQEVMKAPDPKAVKWNLKSLGVPSRFYGCILGLTRGVQQTDTIAFQVLQREVIARSTREVIEMALGKIEPSSGIEGKKACVLTNIAKLSSSSPSVQVELVAAILGIAQERHQLILSSKSSLQISLEQRASVIERVKELLGCRERDEIRPVIMRPALPKNQEEEISMGQAWRARIQERYEQGEMTQDNVRELSQSMGLPPPEFVGDSLTFDSSLPSFSPRTATSDQALFRSWRNVCSLARSSPGPLEDLPEQLKGNPIFLAHYAQCNGLSESDSKWVDTYLKSLSEITWSVLPIGSDPGKLQIGLGQLELFTSEIVQRASLQWESREDFAKMMSQIVSMKAALLFQNFESYELMKREKLQNAIEKTRHKQFTTVQQQTEVVLLSTELRIRGEISMVALIEAEDMIRCELVSYTELWFCRLEREVAENTETVERNCTLLQVNYERSSFFDQASLLSAELTQRCLHLYVEIATARLTHFVPMLEVLEEGFRNEAMAKDVGPYRVKDFDVALIALEEYRRLEIVESANAQYRMALEELEYKEREFLRIAIAGNRREYFVSCIETITQEHMRVLCIVEDTCRDNTVESEQYAEWRELVEECVMISIGMAFREEETGRCDMAVEEHRLWGILAVGIFSTERDSVWRRETENIFSTESTRRNFLMGEFNCSRERDLVAFSHIVVSIEAKEQRQRACAEELAQRVAWYAITRRVRTMQAIQFRETLHTLAVHQLQEATLAAAAAFSSIQAAEQRIHQRLNDVMNRSLFFSTLSPSERLLCFQSMTQVPIGSSVGHEVPLPTTGRMLLVDSGCCDVITIGPHSQSGRVGEGEVLGAYVTTLEKIITKTATCVLWSFPIAPDVLHKVPPEHCAETALVQSRERAIAEESRGPTIPERMKIAYLRRHRVAEAIGELLMDVQEVQPKDLLQYMVDWMVTKRNRQKEQRAKSAPVRRV